MGIQHIACRCWVCSVACVCLAALGCGHSPDLPPLAEVEGIVTLDGKPVPRGMVQFVPDESKGTKGPPAVGVIDENGHYELTTAGVQGAVVGHHRVAVRAQEEFDDMTISMGRSLIPDRYRLPESSDLRAEVTEGKTNEVDLPLRSTP